MENNKKQGWDDFLKENLHCMIFLGFILVGAFVPVLASSGNWTLSGNTGTLTNYTVPLNVTYQTGMQSDFRDIHFNETSGTALSFEFDTINSNINALVWVRIPSLTTGGYNISMYWNDGTEWANNTVDAWDDNYLTVIHFNEGTGTLAKDSRNKHNFTGWGSSSPAWVTGVWGGGSDLEDDNNNFWNTSSSSDFDLCTTAFTIEGFINYETLPTINPFGTVMSRMNAGYNWAVQVDANGKINTIFRKAGGGVSHPSTATITQASNWYGVSGSWDNTGNTIDSMLNSTYASETKTDTPEENTQSVLIGCQGWGTGAFCSDRTIDGIIDEVRLSNVQRGSAWMNYTYQIIKNNNQYTLFTSDSTIPSSTVSISNPTNTTYYLTAISPQYTATSYTNSTFNCSIYYDGNSTAFETISTTNSTLTTGSSKSLEHGAHSVNVTCTDTGGAFSDIEYFTTLDYGVTAETYQSIVYETNSTAFSLQVNTSSRINYVNASLNYNGVWYTGTGTQSGTLWDFSKILNVPVVQANNTNITFYWGYNATYVNTTVVEVSNTAHNQTAAFAYYWSSYSLSPSSILEGGEFTAYGVVSKILNYATLASWVNFNSADTTATLASSTSVQNNYETDLTAPEITGYNSTYPTYSTLNITFEGNTRLVNSTTANETVYAMWLGSCSGLVNTTVLTFNSTHEENSTSHPVIPLDVYFSMWNGAATKEYNATLSGASSYSVCMYPWFGVFETDLISHYDSAEDPGYSFRWYLLQNATITNSTTQIDLYSLPDSDSTEILFSVQSSGGQPEADVIIKALRYYVGSNTYKTVAMCLTDDEDGACSMYLKKEGVWYQFILEKDGEVLKTFDNVQLTSTTKAFNLDSEEGGDYWQYYDNIASSCSVSTPAINTTRIISCTVTDTSNMMQSTTLTVKKIFAMTNATVCTNTAYSSGSTVICEITNVTGNIYSYTVDVVIPGSSTLIIEQDWLDYSSTSWYGTYGLVPALILITTLTFIGIWNPAATIFMALFGVGISMSMGLLDLTFANLIALVVAGVILMWKMRT